TATESDIPPSGQSTNQGESQPAQNGASAEPTEGGNHPSDGAPASAGNSAAAKDKDKDQSATKAAPSEVSTDENGDEESADTPPPAPAKATATKSPVKKTVVDDNEEADDTASKARSTKPAAAKPVDAGNPDDALVANAEKYLYGRGVPQNCDRALSALRAAAG